MRIINQPYTFPPALLGVTPNSREDSPGLGAAVLARFPMPGWALALLLIPCLLSPAWPGAARAFEAGLDLRDQERKRYHQDTGAYSTTVEISELSLFAEAPFDERWRGRMEAAARDYTLSGPESRPRIAATITTVTPRVYFKTDDVKMRGTLINNRIEPQSSLYTPSGEDQQLLLPGLDFTFSPQPLELTAGAWREFDLLPRPDNTYTPVVYQTLFVGLSTRLGTPWRLGGQLGFTSREIPDDLPQDRWEGEMFIHREDPIDHGEGATWQRSTLKAVAWHYNLDGEDTLFLKWLNVLRARTGKVTHALKHTLTWTDTYVVYEGKPVANDPTPSTVEVDRKGSDIQQKVDYTAWSRLGENPWYWRAGAFLDQSIAQEAFLEFGVKAGITKVF